MNQEERKQRTSGSRTTRSGGSGRFWKPGTSFPGLDDVENDRATEREGGLSVVYNQNATLSIAQQRQQLPIYKYRTDILYILEKYRVLIIVGETGCGKTTQIPQYLLEANWCAASGAKNKCIACTQPRRVSAVTVAQRVSEERGTILGSQVGYCIQFDDRTDDSKTKIKYMTDGMLLREMMLDPLLSSYSVIMVDEAHERSLHTDLLLGLLKKVMRRRKELRLIISSATIDAEMFKDFFSETRPKELNENDTTFILSIPGRTYPVQLYYTTNPVSNYLEACLKTVLNIHQHEEKTSGDILVFLTGQDEIEQFIGMLNNVLESGDQNRNRPLLTYPLYSGLPIEQQMKVFEDDSYSIDGARRSRKVIVATNVAETSVTIPSIVYVVDSGFVKQRVFDPLTNSEMLVVTEISKASAQQRAGRAGRVRPGQCYRIYTESAYQRLRPGNVPEIQRSDMIGPILQLKALGIDDIAHFPFVSPPPSEHMIRALELLYALGALDNDGRLTNPLGLQMAEFPVEPQIAKMLLLSGKMGCSEEALTIAAMLSVQNIYANVSGNLQVRADVAKRKFAVIEGDHLTFLNIFTSFLRMKNNQTQWCHENFINYKSMMRVVNIRKQLQGYMRKFSIAMVSAFDDRTNYDTLASPSEIVRKCVLHGFFYQAAMKQPDGSYLAMRSQEKLYIHPSSVLFKYPPKWVVYSEIVKTTKNYIRDVMSIEPDWLPEVAPHFYESAAKHKLQAVERGWESNEF